VPTQANPDYADAASGLQQHWRCIRATTAHATRTACSFQLKLLISLRLCDKRKSKAMATLRAYFCGIRDKAVATLRAV
jgi:hypothetical protein